MHTCCGIWRDGQCLTNRHSLCAWVSVGVRARETDTCALRSRALLRASRSRAYRIRTCRVCEYLLISMQHYRYILCHVWGMKPLAAHGQRQGQGTSKQPSQAIAKLGVNRLGTNTFMISPSSSKISWVHAFWHSHATVQEEATHQLMRLLHELTYTWLGKNLSPQPHEHASRTSLQSLYWPPSWRKKKEKPETSEVPKP